LPSVEITSAVSFDYVIDNRETVELFISNNNKQKILRRGKHR